MRCKKKEEESSKELNTKTDIGWGHQIRSLRITTIPAS